MTCSSHSDRRGDSGLLVGQVCRSGQQRWAKTSWHGNLGPWKVLESVAAGRARLQSGTWCWLCLQLFLYRHAECKQEPGAKISPVWPHTGHLSAHTHTYRHMHTDTRKHSFHTQTYTWIPAKKSNTIHQNQIFSEIFFKLHTHLCW